MELTLLRVRRPIRGRRTRAMAHALWGWETVAGFILVLSPLLIGVGAGVIASAETRKSQRSVGITDVVVNNGTLALILIAGILVLGLPALLLIPGWFVNGYTIGSALASGHVTEFAINVLPHAISEIAGFALATSAGLSGIRMAVHYVSKSKRNAQESSKAPWRQSAVRFFATATTGLALIMLGAAIEGTISRPQK